MAHSKLASLKKQAATAAMSNLLNCDLFTQCFDTVGWVTGRASGLYKLEW